MAAAADFGIEKTSPENGSTGMSVDNMGVKVYFNEDVNSKANRKANSAKCKLVDNKGKTVPSRVVFNPDEHEVMMVLAETGNAGAKKAKIKGDTKYKLIIDEGFISDKGHVLKEAQTISFKTLNPKSSMTVSMAMMGVMVVGMVFFTSREAKKTAKEQAKSKEDSKVNPYKVAKKTGKSVEEIVAKEDKKKSKSAAAAARKNKKDSDDEEEEDSGKKKVSRPRPISEAGSSYKAAVKKKPQPNNGGKKNQPQKKKSQNPNKNKGKRKK